MPYRNQALPIFLEHQSRLVAYAARILGCRQRAEDVVQDAYLRFSQAFGGEPLNQPINYLYRIVRNLAVDISRHNTLERELMTADRPVEEFEQAQPTPEDAALHRDELRIVMEALSELPLRTRKAVEMHRFDGKKLHEIASALDISVGLAHGLVFDGIDHCRQRLQAQRSPRAFAVRKNG